MAVNASQSAHVEERLERARPQGGAALLARLDSGELLQLAIVLHLLALIVLVLFIKGDFNYGTIDLYQGYGNRILQGQVPYHDFTIEYPPLATLFFVLPALLTRDPNTYRVLLALLMVVVDFGGVVVTLWTIRRVAPSAGLYGVLIAQPLLLLAAGKSITLMRFDLAPAVLTLLALALYTARRERLAWIVLGLGTALKLYPILLAPFLVMLAVKRRAWRPLLIGLCWFGAAVLLPSLLVTHGDLFSLARFVAYHENRGLEIESLSASLLMPLGLILHIPGYFHVYAFGSEELRGPFVALALSLATPLTALGLGAVYLLAWRHISRSGDEPEEQFQDLVAFTAAALLCFMVLGKVFSPQYLLWLYPLAAVWTRRRETLWLWLGSALLLALWIFPYNWDGLIHFEPLDVAILLLRNLELVALLFLILSPYLRALPRRDRI